MEKEFVSYEIAVSLKELGFDEECFSFFEDVDVLYNSEGTYKYNDNVWEESEVIAPLKQQVFRWFREKYDLTGLIHIGSQEFSYSVNKDGHRITPLKDYLNYNGTYEEAENECINKLIELSKQQDK
jgi:hypothetical protein